MKNKIDNIGGTILAEYCLVENIQSCGVTSQGILLFLKKSDAWKEFPAKIGKISINIVPEVQNSLSLYKVSGDITCPRNKFSRSSDMFYLADKKIIIRRTTANGDITIVGDMENPISVTAELLNPPSAAGFSGVRYLLSGTMKHPELPLL